MGDTQAARIQEKEDKRLPMGLRQWGAMLCVTRSQRPWNGGGGLRVGGERFRKEIRVRKTCYEQPLPQIKPGGTRGGERSKNQGGKNLEDSD